MHVHFLDCIFVPRLDSHEFDLELTLHILLLRIEDLYELELDVVHDLFVSVDLLQTILLSFFSVLPVLLEVIRHFFIYLLALMLDHLDSLLDFLANVFLVLHVVLEIHGDLIELLQVLLLVTCY